LEVAWPSRQNCRRYAEPMARSQRSRRVSAQRSRCLCDHSAGTVGDQVSQPRDDILRNLTEPRA